MQIFLSYRISLAVRALRTISAKNPEFRKTETIVMMFTGKRFITIRQLEIFVRTFFKVLKIQIDVTSEK